MTPEQIAICTGSTVERAFIFAPALLAGMGFYGIDTPARRAAFLAQIGHESGGLIYTAELWGPTEAQRRYERDFTQPWPSSADEADEDRFERNRLAFRLGNVSTGDGSRYRGHGLIQTTGRGNHRRVTTRLRERFANVPDFEADPKALTMTQWAAVSACDYWDDKGLNALADAGDFRRITVRINGGVNGLRDRVARHKVALAALA
ncbi:MAG: glycoside hydrolase family 19 protein [Ramlibacter sp.]